MVYCTVTIDGLSRQMWLPVMDFKNQAISNPDCVQVNKAKMRCLVKCLAMFGLGHYIYAGEDLPSAEADKAAELEKKQKAALEEKIDVDTLDKIIGLIKETGSDEKVFLDYFKVEKIADMNVVQAEVAVTKLETKKGMANG